MKRIYLQLSNYETSFDKLQNEHHGNSLKLKNKEDTITQLKVQIDNLNQNIHNLDQHNSELNNNLKAIQSELTNTNSCLMKEKSIRNALEKTLETKENEIQTKIQEVKAINTNSNDLRKDIDKLVLERDQLLNEIEKFKSHIMVLTEANKELMDELDLVIERDEQIRNIIDKENEYNNNSISVGGLSISPNQSKGYLNKSYGQ